jgi:hypothetical protein
VGMPRMRPAIEAELMVSLEAADPYMKPVLGVSKATFCLSRATCRNFRENVCDRARIGKPAHDEGDLSRLSRFSRTFIWKLGIHSLSPVSMKLATRQKERP